MILTLTRKKMTSDSTPGELWVDGKFECFTLEDLCRTGPKVYGETAIPEGTYRVIINMSPKFKKLMMRVLAVPGFDGILIHKGNSDEDTSGCILVGDRLLDGKIVAGTSTPAHDHLYSRVMFALLAGNEVNITIKSEFA